MSQIEAKLCATKISLSQSVPIRSSYFSIENEEIKHIEEEEIDEQAIVVEDINTLWPSTSSVAIPKSPRSPRSPRLLEQEVTFEQCYSISERHSCVGQAFQRFLKKRQNEESLHFLQDVMTFENSFSETVASISTEQSQQGSQEIEYNNTKQICEEAKRITSLFIEPQSTNELNLSCEAKQAFLAQFSTLLAEQAVTNTLFKSLKEIVLIQLKEECFESFLKSEECKEALESLKFINQQQLLDSYRSNRKSLTHWFGEPDEFRKMTQENTKNILNMKKQDEPSVSPRVSPRGPLMRVISTPTSRDATSKSADSFFGHQPLSSSSSVQGERKLERRTSFFGKIINKITRK